MRLTVRRQQSHGRKGTTFSLFFHLGLVPDEQSLVDRYALHTFAIGTAGTLQELQKGVQKEAGLLVEPVLERVWTRAGAHIQDAMKMESAVKKSCRELLTIFTNLRTFNGEHGFDYDSTTDMQSED
jgi:hypothetical protein